MLLLPTLLFVVALIAGGECVHEDSSTRYGACSKPTPVAHFNASQLNGRWFDVYTTYVNAKEDKNKRRCVENLFQADPVGNVLANTSFIDNTGSQQVLRKKWVPDHGQDGKFIIQKMSDDGSKWLEHDWHYTILATEGDKAFVEYGCKTIAGLRHKRFHRIRSRTAVIPADVLAKLQKVIKDANDTNELIIYDQNNCSYQFH